MTASPLRVLVTRPSPQGEQLCALLVAQGFKPIFFPVIEIKPVESNLLHQQISSLNHYTWAIFVSRHAVAKGLPLIHQYWPQWPAQLRVAAVGAGTAQALQQAQLPVHACPPQWSSEGLLALPEFQQLSGKAIAIFCGQGGRELLAAGLTERGASVSLLVVYQRQLPKLDMAPYQKMLKEQEIDAILCTSVQSLQNLQELFATAALKKIPLVLVSERIMIQAKAQGFETCVLAKDASHDSILQALRIIRN